MMVQELLASSSRYWRNDMKRLIALCIAAALTSVQPVWANDDAWEEIRSAIYPDHYLLDGSDHISISAPYRAADDSRAVIGADITLPDGDLISRVHVILDNNPAPVSAILTLENAKPAFAFDVTMRINGPTPVHITAEGTSGRVFVAESFVKTSGLGACSAPPGTDMAEALATLGEMIISFENDDSKSDLLAMAGNLALPQSTSSDEDRARVGVSHPSHSGMQMDQISLLFIPMRTIQTLDVDRNSNPYLNIEGSISLSENPELSFSVPSNTFELGVTMTDTEGAVTRQTKHRLVQ